MSEDKKGNDDSSWSADKRFDDDETNGQNIEERKLRTRPILHKEFSASRFPFPSVLILSCAVLYVAIFSCLNGIIVEETKEEISPDADKHMSIEEQIDFMREQIIGLNEEIAELKASDGKGTDRSGTDEGSSPAVKNTAEARKNDMDEEVDKKGFGLLPFEEGSHRSVRIHLEEYDFDENDAFSRASFKEQLEATIDACRELKKSSLWVDIPMSRAGLIEAMFLSGFRFHHAGGQTVTLKMWLLESEPEIDPDETTRKQVKNLVSLSDSEETTWKQAGNRVSTLRDSGDLHSDLENALDDNEVNNQLSLADSKETTRKQVGNQVSSSRNSSDLYSDFANIVDGNIEPRVANTARKRRRARFLSSTFFGEARPGEEIDLETDIYSLFIISRNWGPSFFFSLTIAFSQFVITALILTDLLERYNTLAESIPPKVDWRVAITQWCSLVIAFVSVDDMMVSLKILVIGYDPDIGIKNPAASYSKFLIANIIRFCEGFCTVTVCVVIIIQSSEVLQLFMDFAAVAFVSELDNMAFELAKDGFLGESLKTQCEKVLTTKVKVQRSARFWLINLTFLFFFSPFFTVLAVVRVRQLNGTYLGQYACKHLDVRFGEEILVFDNDVRFSFVGEGFNKTFANSIRTLPQVDQIPAGLHYQFFTGNYVAEKNDFDRLELYHDRPIYWETIKDPEDHLRGTRGEMLKDPTSGKFYYCGSKSSWVFTIEALFDTPGVMPQQARNECEWGWLMLSPPTQAITLNDAPMEGWSIWTGSTEVSTPEFSISCTDCTRDEDCGLTHGFCDLESRTCNCTDAWQGSRCEAERPFCPGITWVNEGDSSREYSELRPISHLWIPRVYYDRPLYLSPMTTEQNIDVWTIYAGRRWFVTHFEANYLSINSNYPHAYWDNTLTTRAVRYSDPTTSYCPDGLRWNEIEIPRSTGNFGPFGATFPSKGRYESIQVDCMNNSEEVCGRYGTCVTRTEVVNGVEGPYNRCECANFTGGYFCEHHPDQPYSRDMYNEYIVNPAYYRKYNPNEEYWKFWVNETVKAAVVVIDEELFQDRAAQNDYREL